MGDEDPITKLDFNTLMSQMAAMMVEIQSQTQLKALASGTSSTTPPALVDTSDKGDPLNEDDPEKVDDVEADEDTAKKYNMPRGYNSEIPPPVSCVSGRHLQMPHLASCGPLIRLKRIYNFLCSMLVLHQLLCVLFTLLGIFMHFLELTY
jgi:hypothetical protein